jgi:DNA-binding PucR family transcriptional regulator
VASADPGRTEREELSALRSLLELSMLLTQQDSQASIVHFAANAVESLGAFTTAGIFLDGRWQDIGLPARAGKRVSQSAGYLAPDVGPVAEGPAMLPGVPWSWAYPLSAPNGPTGFLVVGAVAVPEEGQRFLLQVLSRQAAVALANAHLHSRQREQAANLQAANVALRRSIEIHDTLTKVALGDEGQPGIARALYELTNLSTAIEDRFGNLQAWAGPGRPDPYPRADPGQRSRLLDRAVAAGAPVRDGGRVISVAILEGAPAGVVVLHDPAKTARDAERMAIEHASMVLTMEISRLQNLAQRDGRLRASLVLDLIGGTEADQGTLLGRAQALSYDLGRPHRVLMIEAHPGDQEIEMFYHAVSRAMRANEVGSLLAYRLRDVIVLADREASWEQFLARVATELNGGRCRIGVGGSCLELSEFPRSRQEAELALRIQKTAGGPERVTLFDHLGVYKVLATAGDTSAMERFVAEWLGQLIDYDARHGTTLVLTLSEYLDCGGNYDASALALSVHRSTLKYRLKRIREVTGHDLGLPEVQFNLQVATHARRTLQAIRLP